MHPLAHHAGEQALAPLLLLLGSGGVPLLVAIGRARLTAARDRLARLLQREREWPGDADQQGYVKRGSVHVFWERYGAGKPDASTAMVHPALDAVTPRARRSTNTGGERGRPIQGRSTSWHQPDGNNQRRCSPACGPSG